MIEVNKNRIKWIDYLKAFACFLVVLGHLLQSLRKIGNYNSFAEFIIYFIYLFHMPLFMCMSGFLYCKTKKEFSWIQYKEFVLKKTINLLIPYLTFYLVFLGINIIFSSSVNTSRGMKEFVGIINNPMPPYWFLYALLSIFIVIPILEKFLKNKNIVFGGLVLLKIISIFYKTNIYFIDSIMSYSIYFYFGSFIKENDEKKNALINLFEILIYIFAAVIYYIYKESCNKVLSGLVNIFFSLSGILISVKIFRTTTNSTILDTFKKYTFQIYLTHTIFAAGIRILLLKMNINSYFIHIIIGLISSIYIPVIMAIISNKIKYTNFFFYPIKTIKELKERKIKNVREET